MWEQLFLDEIDQTLSRIFEKAAKKAWLEGNRSAAQRYTEILEEVRSNGSKRNHREY